MLGVDIEGVVADVGGVAGGVVDGGGALGVVDGGGALGVGVVDGVWCTWLLSMVVVHLV